MKRNLAVIVGSIVLLLDQISKEIVSSQIEFQTTVKVLPIFNLVHIHNKGVSFGLFSNQSVYGPYILAFVSFCIVCVVAFMAYKTAHTVQKFAFGLIIGGAVGNIWDRLTNKGVTDFLDFYIGTYHWPAFNLADVAIVCGAFLIVFHSLTTKENGSGSNV